MTIEIPKEKWADFLNDFTKRRFGWETEVEVLAESIGDQTLSAGLPLNGISYGEKGGKAAIEISVGETAGQHQMHTIVDPLRIAYLLKTNTHGGVLEIEEANGTKTLISLISPMPIYVGYASSEVMIG